MSNPNPSPETRFGGPRGNPQSTGQWSKENSFSYWMNKFKSMTVAEFREYEKIKKDKERSVAESLAYARVHAARSDLKEFNCVADRTEGKPKQVIEQQGEFQIRPYKGMTIEELDAEAKKIIEGSKQKGAGKADRDNNGKKGAKGK